MSALLELAARCEAATGPDRELDKAIACAWQDNEEARTGNCPPLKWAYYTASVDMALTLVPEGWNRSISSIAGKPPSVRLWNDESDIAVWRANTEALAICAAALRARAV